MEATLEPDPGKCSPAVEWSHDAVRRALDDLYTNARMYNSSKAYRELIDFVSRFRFYSPFNAMLIHTQMSGATFVAPAYRWRREFDRVIKAGARPLVILQPMGPVMFVFDVIDTEPEAGARPLPRQIERPFEVRRGSLGDQLGKTTENAKRDGINVVEYKAGSQRAGSIAIASKGRELRVSKRIKPEPEFVSVPLRYDLLVNASHSAEARYATLVHELAHLYCGHLGTPNERWWPDRRGLGLVPSEFEAESVCYLVCKRSGMVNPSEEYLAGYIRNNEQTPSISLECVMKAAGLIEQMGRERLNLRKEKEA
jgi:hypothetical protein